MTLFDIVAGLLILASAMIGFARGAVREVVTLLSFTLAAMAAVFLLPISHPVARAIVHPDWASKVAAIAVVFVTAYIALRIAGASIAAALHRQAALGALDRTLGFLLGSARGLVALGLFCLVFAAVTPRFLQPAWIVGGPAYSIGRMSGDMIADLGPQGLKAVGGFGKAMKDQVVADPSDTADPVSPSGASASDASDAPALSANTAASKQDVVDSSTSAPPDSSGSAPYAAHRHRHRRSATLTVINRPAE